MRALLALCLACALGGSARGLEITSDYIIDARNVPPAGPGEMIHVRGDATLTVQAGPDGITPRGIGAIALHDTASLTVLDGELRGKISLFGNHRLEFLGGAFDNTLVDVFGGATEIDVVGAVVRGDWKFQQGGEQRIEVTGAVGLGPRIIGNDHTSVDLTVYDDPVHTFHDGEWFYLGGHPTDTNEGFGMYVSRDVSWSVNATHQLPGDLDNSGAVDIADLNAVRNFFGSHNFQGDTLPFDGEVDITDLNVVRNSFGDSFAQSTPEPSSLAIVVILMAGWASRRTWRRSNRQRPS